VPADREKRIASVDDLLTELRAGRPVILVDDEQRENEGDLILPAATITTELVAFTIRYTGGVICMAMPNELADHLELPPMVEHNSAPRNTAYTVSIEARGGVTTGISAQDRATTIRTTVKARVSACDRCGPATCFRCGLATGVCYAGPVTPRPRSTFVAWPVCHRSAR
jgi:3,4-dihydroxy-2-butanone 4-phosphate synthase